ncbi:MAG: cysteine hydrolase [Candidatus Marinimicrobia bacterium]|nr:cysteine hydrolase [Candidatus Neomarinimicrobiota bacterium]
MSKINSSNTALLVIDPQNDFLAETGVVWDLVGEGVVKNQVVDKLSKLIAKAKESGVEVFYSPHYYDKEFEAWKDNNPIDSLMFERKMFDRNSSGSDFHPDLTPDDSTIICAPHKNLSGFHTSDVDIQLRKRGIDTIYLCGMAANLCVESHLRDAEERGYKVIVINDATAAPGDAAYDAALINYGFIAHESITAEEALSRF